MTPSAKPGSDGFRGVPWLCWGAWGGVLGLGASVLHLYAGSLLGGTAALWVRWVFYPGIAAGFFCHRYLVASEAVSRAAEVLTMGMLGALVGLNLGLLSRAGGAWRRRKKP